MKHDSFSKPRSGDANIPNKVELNRQKPAAKTARKQALFRVNEIAGPNGMFPISLSSWWAGVKAGIYPQPVQLGERMTAWRAEDLEQLARHGINAGPFSSHPNSGNGEEQS